MIQLTGGKSSRKGSSRIKSIIVAVTTSVEMKPTKLSQLSLLNDRMNSIGSMSRQVAPTAQWKLLTPCMPVVHHELLSKTDADSAAQDALDNDGRNELEVLLRREATATSRRPEGRMFWLL